MKDLPSLTAKQMAKVDDLMVNDFGVTILQMMEHDGVALMKLSEQILDDLNNKKIIVVFGSGGNGGGVLAAARMLHNAGALISLVTSSEEEKRSHEVRQQLAACVKLGLKIHPATAEIFKDANLIIDGLLGYSISGAPRGKVADIINLINATGTLVLSNDLPSGLDPTTGEIYQPTIKADYTLTIALPKKGLMSEAAQAVVGTLFLADISVPDELYKKLELLTDNIFDGKLFIKL